MVSVLIDRKAGLSSAAAWKGPCRVATTANITLAGLQTLDGVTVESGDRVLVKDQTDTTQNGIYIADTGDWVRAKDFSRNDDVVCGTQVAVTHGAVGQGAYQLTTADPIVFETSAITLVANATANAGSLLTAIKTVDGSGSGLDADLLDGQHGAYYLPAASYTAADVLAKLLTVDGAGSGLDADTLDGVSSAGFLQTSAIGTTVQGFDATLAALAAFNTNGILTQTAADTFAGRTLTGTTNQITVTNGNGVSGNPTLSLPADVVIPTIVTAPNTGLHILDTDASHDLIVKPGSNLTADRTLTVTTGDSNRTLDISAADVTVSAAAATVLDDASVGAMLSTLGGQPLDATLTALAAFNTNGLLTQTAADTFTGRTITGTVNQITVTNGNGVSGNPTLSLDATLAALAALTITNGSFIRGTGADAFAVQALIGTVSQSGGVATGAIVEKGSDANGTYIKYLDGTMICEQTTLFSPASTTADGTLFRSTQQAWTFPGGGFVSGDVPLVVANCVQVSGFTSAWASSNTAGVLLRWTTASQAGTVALTSKAWGHWF